MLLNKPKNSDLSYPYYPKLELPATMVAESILNAGKRIYSVSYSADDSIIVVACGDAPVYMGQHPFYNFANGEVQIWKREGTTYVKTQTILRTAAFQNFSFGVGSSINQGGNCLIVRGFKGGSPYYTYGETYHMNESGQFVPDTAIVVSSSTSLHFLAVSTDGETALARVENTTFRYTYSGTAWTRLNSSWYNLRLSFNPELTTVVTSGTGSNSLVTVHGWTKGDLADGIRFQFNEDAPMVGDYYVTTDPTIIIGLRHSTNINVIDQNNNVTNSGDTRYLRYSEIRVKDGEVIRTIFNSDYRLTYVHALSITKYNYVGLAFRSVSTTVVGWFDVWTTHRTNSTDYRVENQVRITNVQPMRSNDTGYQGSLQTPIVANPDTGMVYMGDRTNRTQLYRAHIPVTPTFLR